MHTEEHGNERVMVIGGGLTGLIAGCKLAQAGKRVTLLERAKETGGRARSIEKQGAHLNMGPHAYYLGGAFERLLHELGVKVTGAAPPNKQMLLLWGGKLVSMPRLLASNAYLSWADKAELVRVLLYFRRLDVSSIERMSLRDFAERTTRYPAVRHLLYALLRTVSYTLNPNEQLAQPVIAMLHRSFGEGLLYVDGGWQTIVDQLEECFIRAGGVLQTSGAVRQIEHAAGQVTGVRLADGCFLEASSVIMTAGPSECLRLVEGGEQTILRRWKEEAKPSTVASLDLCLARLPVAGRNFAIGIDQPILFTNNSASAKLTNDGSQVIHLAKYHAPGEQDPAADERLLEETVDLLHPGWRKEVVVRQFLPRMTVVHDYSHLGRSAAVIGPEVAGINGLFVAGDWASHGNELLSDAAAASAERAVSAVLSLVREPAYVAR